MGLSLFPSCPVSMTPAIPAVAERLASRAMFNACATAGNLTIDALESFC